MGVFLQSFAGCFLRLQGRSGLNRPQTSVNTVLSNENFVGAVLDDFSFFKNQNSVGMADGGEPVRDHHRCSISGDSVNRPLEGGLGFVINGRRRLVENEERGISRTALAIATR